MKINPLIIFPVLLGIAITSSFAFTFNQLDTNKDGVITSEDITAVFEGDHKNMDKNKDGVISVEEWPAGPEPFRNIDLDKDGELSLEELAQWRIRCVIAPKDKNKDGELDAEEYESP